MDTQVCRWTVLLRLYEALKQKLRSQPLVHGDETWVQVLKEDGRDAIATSYAIRATSRMPSGS